VRSEPPPAAIARPADTPTRRTCGSPRARAPALAGRDGWLTFVQACPELLAPHFTLDDAGAVFDFVADDREGLGMEEFVSALQTVAVERYPETGETPLRRVRGRLPAAAAAAAIAAPHASTAARVSHRLRPPQRTTPARTCTC
jgi:hypothetical protein